MAIKSQVSSEILVDEGCRLVRLFRGGKVSMGAVQHILKQCSDDDLRVVMFATRATMADLKAIASAAQLAT